MLTFIFMPTRIMNQFRRLVTPVILALVLGATRAHATTCPSQAPRTLEIARHLATSNGSAATRARYQLPSLTAAQVRLLSDQQGDSTTCAKLMEFVAAQESGTLTNPDLRLTFFEAGDYCYVVAVRADTVDPLPPGVIRTGWQLLWVIDARGAPTVIAKIPV